LKAKWIDSLISLISNAHHSSLFIENDVLKYDLIQYWNLIEQHRSISVEDVYLAETTKLKEQGETVEICNMMKSISLILHALCRYNASFQLSEQVLALQKVVLGEVHPDIAQTLRDLGHIKYLEESFLTARKYFEDSLAIRKLVFGESHPEVAKALNNVAVIHYHMEHFSTAKPLYKQVLAIYRKEIGEINSSVANVLMNLGNLLSDDGETEEAKQHFEQSLTINKKLYGETHPDLAICYSNLGHLYHYREKNYAKAEFYYNQSIQIYKKLFGNTHPTLAHYMHSLSMLLDAQGRTEQAFLVCEEALIINTKIFGEKHDVTQRVQRTLTKLQERDCVKE